jgi:hypothetical protein
MRARLGLGPDPHDPRDNIVAGTFYLRLMFERFGYPGLFAAYNAGPARYARHVAVGRALPAETRTYVAAVVGEATTLAPARPAPPGRMLPRAGSGIFFMLSAAAREARTKRPDNTAGEPDGEAEEDGEAAAPAMRTPFGG